jgi:hypothetical protein
MCLFFSLLGLLVGFFLVIASFNPQSTPGIIWAGLILLAICAIPWVNWFNKKSKGFQRFSVGQAATVQQLTTTATQPNQQRQPAALQTALRPINRTPRLVLAGILRFYPLLGSASVAYPGSASRSQASREQTDSVLFCSTLWQRFSSV